MTRDVDKTEIEDAVFSLEEKDVKFIRLQFTDILGIPKDVEITLDEFPKALEEGIAFDGSSIEGFARICESDMYLHPDLDTLKIYPWKSVTSEGEEYGNARIICDVNMPDGEPFEGDPRYRLRKAQKEAGEKGLRMFVGAEPEFFMFRSDGEEELRNSSTELHDQGGYFDLMPVDKGEEARKDIVISLEKMGFEVEAAHHEVAPSQHEIDFRYGDAVTLADQLITFKTTTKTIALKHGLNATFMPKPYEEINGSGMHTHVSLKEDGENCFYQPDNPYDLSDKALHFVGGLIEHIGALTALCNPTINSYKRLVPGYEAPVNISWGRRNRSVLIRVPATSTPKESTRVEFRSPDPTANPYLAFAGILKAGLHGIEEQIEPPDPVEEDLYEMKAGKKAERGIGSLPGSLTEALDALEEDDLIAEAIGSHIMENYLKAKRTEARDYQVNVTDWELEKYMKYY